MKSIILNNNNLSCLLPKKNALVLKHSCVFNATSIRVIVAQNYR